MTAPCGRAGTSVDADPVVRQRLIEPVQLDQITLANLVEAVAVAREIFPYEVHADGFWPELAYRQAITEQRSDFAYYIARHAGQAVGITGHYPSEDGKPEIWLGWYGVRPAFRRMGHGANILRATAEIIVRWCAVLNLYSGDREEERPAHRLYQRHGLEQIGRGEVDGAPVLYFRGPIPLCQSTELANNAVRVK